jgi:hypothetical protein
MDQTAPLRLLLLHPYASDGASFTRKSASFRNLCGLSGATCIAPDAPHILGGGATELATDTAEQARFRWFCFGEEDPPVDAPIEEFLRLGAHLEGVEQSVAKLRTQLSAAPVAGWICFSQGAVMVCRPWMSPICLPAVYLHVFL